MFKKTNEKPKETKKKAILITISILALVIVCLFAGGIAYGYGLFDKMDRVDLNKDNLGIDKSIDNELSKYNGIYNIALFGIDAPQGKLGRSDCIMILTIDTTKNKIKVSSLMRDCYVPIDGHGTDKLNHAYAFGDAELAIKTINENFDLNITNFASVNFTNLPKLIDKLGGIDLNIIAEELPSMNSCINQLNSINETNSNTIPNAGKYHVDGTQALAYSRVRHATGGDYERTHRQRTVLTALFEKFKVASPSDYPDLLNEFLPMVKTNLTPSEIIGLGTKVVKMGDITLEQARFPEDQYCQGTMIDKIYYLKFNKDETVKQLHEFMFGSTN